MMLLSRLKSKLSLVSSPSLTTCRFGLTFSAEAIDELWDTFEPLVKMANQGKPFPKPKLTYVVVGKR